MRSKTISIISSRIRDKYQSDEDLYRAVFSIKKSEIEKAWRIRHLSKKLQLGHKRAISEKARFFVKRLKESRRVPFDERLWLIKQKKYSKILDFLSPARNQSAGWIHPRRRAERKAPIIIDIGEFSFIDNPIKTMDALQKIADAERYAASALINFRDEYCLDVSPFMVLSEFWDEMLPVFSGGHMEPPVQKVLSVVGLQSALRIQFNGVDNYSNVWSFPLQRRRPRGSSSSKRAALDVQKREVVADRFCDALDRWLEQPEISRELNQEGRGWIKNILGEILENAERHSDGYRQDGEWSVSGFMVRRKDRETDAWFYKVFIGIVSIGDTIYQSFERASSEIKEKIKTYIKRMHSRGCRISAETLTTLVALQDGVTSVSEADEQGRGGYGLQEMLDLVNILGNTEHETLKPRVTIISGRSCIKLRTPYVRGQRMGSEMSPRVLWCNDANSNADPPDERFVFDLACGIPGTVISIGFILDPDYLNGSDSPDGAGDACDRT